MQLRDAAEILGVHYQTAYGWVRQGTLRARKTPRGYEVSESDVRDLLARREAGAEPPRELQVRDWAAQADRLYTAMVAGDETQARRDFGRLAAGVPLAGLCDHLAADTGASLIALSSATSGAARLAAKETREIRERLPNTRVVAGRPGDTLSRLRELARACPDPGQ
jgi:excisionase family DNA binding protein